MAHLRDNQVDLRFLSDQDKRDFQQGGGYGAQVTAYKRAKQRVGDMNYRAQMQERTTTQTPGTGGFTGGIEQQQDRYREIGLEKSRAKSLRPDLDDNLYDIYS